MRDMKYRCKIQVIVQETHCTLFTSYHRLQREQFIFWQVFVVTQISVNNIGVMLHIYIFSNNHTKPH
jgi:hypothetical protein